jgi:hypothetical protein
MYMIRRGFHPEKKMGATFQTGFYWIGLEKNPTWAAGASHAGDSFSLGL